MMAPQQVIPDDLMGVTEAAQFCGFSRQRLAWLRRQGRFPVPFVSLACGDVWLRQDLMAWLRVPRPTGRPTEGKAS